MGGIDDDEAWSGWQDNVFKLEFDSIWRVWEWRATVNVGQQCRRLGFGVWVP